VAENTYKTVSLSSAVSGMIREGVDSFEALINLQMPDIQTFESREIQGELSRLTQRMGEPR